MSQLTKVCHIRNNPHLNTEVNVSGTMDAMLAIKGDVWVSAVRNWDRRGR
jgi:hypothetical protein